MTEEMLHRNFEVVAWQTDCKTQHTLRIVYILFCIWIASLDGQTGKVLIDKHNFSAAVVLRITSATENMQSRLEYIQRLTNIMSTMGCQYSLSLNVCLYDNIVEEEVEEVVEEEMEKERDGGSCVEVEKEVEEEMWI